MVLCRVLCNVVQFSFETDSCCGNGNKLVVAWAWSCWHSCYVRPGPRALRHNCTNNSNVALGPRQQLIHETCVLYMCMCVVHNKLQVYSTSCDHVISMCVCVSTPSSLHLGGWHTVTMTTTEKGAGLRPRRRGGRWCLRESRDQKEWHLTSDKWTPLNYKRYTVQNVRQFNLTPTLPMVCGSVHNEV